MLNKAAEKLPSESDITRADDIELQEICETIAKVLDKDTSLAEKIRTLFREQGITIASILTAIGMAIGVLVEVLLPGASGGGGAATSGGGAPPPKFRKSKQ